MDPIEARHQQRRWLLGVGVPAVALMACGTVALYAYAVAIAAPTTWPQLSEALGVSEEAALSAALSARWDPDDTIPTASFGFDANASTNAAAENGAWLVIEISYTQRCSTTAADPCEALANELAQIVFDHYTAVGELAGLRVVIGDRPHNLNVEPADIIFEKALTIEAWRADLAARD